MIRLTIKLFVIGFLAGGAYSLAYMAVACPHNEMRVVCDGPF